MFLLMYQNIGLDGTIHTYLTKYEQIEKKWSGNYTNLVPTPTPHE